jgi:uncharacterized cupin superfamily protein
MERRDPIVRAVDREKKGLESFSHPLNPERSQMRGFSLSTVVGLTRIGVHFAVLPPGKESFVYHSHAVEEEWLYVLAGRGRIEIDGEQHELVAGDFVGFATPSVAHQLRNPYDQDLTYLTGGERKDVEIAEFPRLGKVMVRLGFEAVSEGGRRADARVRRRSAGEMSFTPPREAQTRGRRLQRDDGRSRASNRNSGFGFRGNQSFPNQDEQGPLRLMIRARAKIWLAAQFKKMTSRWEGAD